MDNQMTTLWKFLFLFAASVVVVFAALWLITPHAVPQSCDSEGVAKSIVPRMFADDYPAPTAETDTGATDTVEGVIVIGWLPDNTCIVEITTNYDLVMKYNFHYDGDIATATLIGPVP